ncbi:unnamed protein product [Notodromas monacha]|uniref:SET domain-containing protein n=1 Tax=Notodromas monacha TaxID=399045 RepID=A0A7R9BND3_9CRUS|nr:unnamed protein product [Notodromas monacha]CAG0918704.1 unnamed protein product [Notodromas monacha]
MDLSAPPSSSNNSLETFLDLTSAFESAYQPHELHKIFDDFKKMEDDEKLRYIFENSVFSAMNIQPITLEKDNESSQRMRKDGNAEFAQRKFESAMYCFTKSILLAEHSQDNKNNNNPEKTSDLANAYFNRANSLFQLKRFSCAIKDLRRALQSGFAKNQCYKLHALESKCWEKMEHYEKALNTFRLACNSQPESGQGDNNEPDKAVVKRINELASKVFEQKGIFIDDEEETAAIAAPSRALYIEIGKYRPKLPDTKNTKLRAASSAVEMRFSKESGRHLISNRDIPPGEVLIMEKPFAQVLMPKHWQTHCFHCLYQTDVPVPCSTCAMVIFCSESCKEAATYHSHECPILGNLSEENMATLTILATRIALVAGLESMRTAEKYLQNLDNPDYPESIAGQACESSDYLQICAQVTHKEKWSGMMTFQVGLIAAYVTLLLEKTGYFGSFENTSPAKNTKKAEVLAKMLKETSGMQPPDQAVLNKGFNRKSKYTTYYSTIPSEKKENMLLVGKFLMRHLMTLRSNRFSITETLVEREKPQGQNVTYKSFGRAVCATLSLCNHSCCCNTCWELIGDHIVLRAIKPITAGDEITMTYGHNFHTDPYEHRRRVLQSDFMFTCTCEACSEHWPTVRESMERPPAFRCPSCRSAMPETSSCPECGRDCQQEFFLLANSWERFQVARAKIDALEITEAESQVLRHVAAVDAVVHPSNIEHVMALDTFKQICILSGRVTTKNF